MGVTIKLTTKQQLYKLQDGLCHYCKRRMNWSHSSPLQCTGDHIRTRSRNGGTNIQNLVGACKDCNNNRGNIPYGAFKEFVEIYGPGIRPLTMLRKLGRERYEAHKTMWDEIMGVTPIEAYDKQNYPLVKQSRQFIDYRKPVEEMLVRVAKRVEAEPPVNLTTARVGRTWLADAREMFRENAVQ